MSGYWGRDCCWRELVGDDCVIVTRAMPGITVEEATLEACMFARRRGVLFAFWFHGQTYVWLAFPSGKACRVLYSDLKAALGED